MAEQSFMKSLFHNVIAEGMIFPFPQLPPAELNELNGLLDTIRSFFSSQVDSAAIDQSEAIPPAVMDGLKHLGLFGMTIPKEYGGMGLTSTGYARVLEEIWGFDPAVALTLDAHQSTGLRALLLFGSEELKARLLPKLAKGELVAAFALTETSGGSDGGAIRTHAELSADGQSYTLRGSKAWITNAPIAQVFTVFARTSRQEEGIKPKVTAFLVERGTGVGHGAVERKLGVRGSPMSSVSLDDVTVPLSHVLGEKGRGFMVAADVLNTSRVGLASGCLGVCKKLIKLTVDRCQERRAFNRPIGEFGLTKNKVAEMMADTYALESMVYLTTGLMATSDYSVESAICKVFGSETLSRIVHETLQVVAGIGYVHPHPYERLLRDSRAPLMAQGTNEVLRCFIALSGLQGPGRELSDVAKAIRDPIKGFGLLSDFALRKARTALGRERFTRAHPVLNREAVIFEGFTADLARNADRALRKHGRDIAEMQFTQQRIADIAIDLYGIASVLARTSRAIESKGEEGARREIDLTSVFVAGAEKRLAARIESFDKNDDELRKSIAARSYTDGGYPFDIL